MGNPRGTTFLHTFIHCSHAFTIKMISHKGEKQAECLKRHVGLTHSSQHWTLQTHWNPRYKAGRAVSPKGLEGLQRAVAIHSIPGMGCHCKPAPGRTRSKAGAKELLSRICWWALAAAVPYRAPSFRSPTILPSSVSINVNELTGSQYFFLHLYPNLSTAHRNKHTTRTLSQDDTTPTLLRKPKN